MQLALILLSLVLASAGNAAIWIYLANRVHATGYHRVLLRAVSLPMHLLVVLGPPALAAALYLQWPDVSSGSWPAMPVPLAVYLGCCAAVAVGPLPRSLWQRRATPPPERLLETESRRLELREHNADARSGALGRALLALPANQALQLEVNEKRLLVPRLEPTLAGLSIAHLSDLHLTGKIDRAYFEHAIDEANRLDCDVAAVTGDLLDKAACLDWLPETLGRLRAPLGVYFVLGNHDRRYLHLGLRRVLEECGLIDVGGRWLQLDVEGRHVIVAGNELPWFGPAPDMRNCPVAMDGRRPLRVLLSHSPDQVGWARAYDFDLMLAGHTHGGQIRLPLIGPVVAPSRYGVRYCGGTYDLPPTALHVSRGLSGKTPLRFNCPPELTKLVLVPATAEHKGEHHARQREPLVAAE